VEDIYSGWIKEINERMKNVLLLLITVVLLATAFQGRAQTITSVTVLPANPTPSDSITIITISSFPTYAYTVISPMYVDTVNHTIVIQLFKCQSTAAPDTSITDTFHIRPLPQGLYSLSVLLFKAQTDVSGNCGTFGVVDSDNSYITVATSPTSLTEDNAREYLSVYPNPANGTLYLSGASAVHATITDISGRIVKQEGSVQKIDISQLPAGIYCCTILNANGYRSSRSFTIAR
jgi:hypothetical protein